MLAADEPAVLLILHAERRAARRNITPIALEYVLTYGRSMQCYPRDLLFPGTARRARNRSPGQLGRSARRHRGPHDQRGAILTVYRQHKALPTIRRKLKFRQDLPSKMTIGTAILSEHHTHKHMVEGSSRQ